MAAESSQQGHDASGDEDPNNAASAYEESSSDDTDDGSDSEYLVDTGAGSDTSNDSDHERAKKRLKPLINGEQQPDKTSVRPRKRQARNAREQAARRHVKKYDKLRNHVWKIRRIKGPTLEASSIGPPTTRLRKIRNKAASDQAPREPQPMDDNAPSTFVLKKRRHQQISQATVVGGINNRHNHTQRRDVAEAQALFGHGRLEALNKNGKPVSKLLGTQSEIPNAQLVALAWWVKRETDDRPPYGGILGDTPGLGKTIITLNAIVANPPTAEEKASGRGATLIVLPNQDTIRQWRDEIGKHLGDGFSDDVYVYSKTSAGSSGGFDAARISKFTFVFTTYAQVERGNPTASRKRKSKKSTAEDSLDEFGDDLGDEAQSISKKQCDLFKIHWYRAVFDEGQALKNKNAKTLKAALGLKKQHCWILSGTPVINGAKELFPYFKLIGCPLAQDPRDYKRMFVTATDAKRKRDALVSLYSFRRISGDYCLDEPVLDLPESQSITHWVNLSEEERLGYQFVSEYFSTGVPDPKQLMITQKQVVSHPFLLEIIFRPRPGSARIDTYAEKLAKIENKKRSIYSQLGPWDKRHQKTPERGQSAEPPTRPLKPFGKSDFGLLFGFSKLMQGLQGLQDIASAVCELCQTSPPLDPQRANKCDHIFCNKCISTSINQWLMNGKLPPCPACNDEWKGTSPLVVSTPVPPSKKSGKQRPGEDFNRARLKLDERLESLFLRSMAENNVPTPSAKTTAVKEIILRWNKESTEHQGIVFCEYKVTCVIIGRMLQLEGINFVYLAGDLTTSQREESIQSFRDNKKVRYMVATTKCAGHALNFTNADRAIIVDPWWNEASAKQAFGRVLRRGQKKMTQLVSIFARNTIDEDIQSRQGDKQGTIDEALHDDGHKTEIQNDWQALATLYPGWFQSLVQGHLDEFVE